MIGHRPAQRTSVLRLSLSRGVENSCPQQDEAGSAVHLPLDCLQPVDVSFYRAVAPWPCYRSEDRSFISTNPRANRRTSGHVDASLFASQAFKVSPDCMRINAANSSARPSALASSSLPARMASSLACSVGLRRSRRRTHSKDNCFADGRGNGGGTAARTRCRGFPAALSRFVTYRRTLP